MTMNMAYPFDDDTLIVGDENEGMTMVVTFNRPTPQGKGRRMTLVGAHFQTINSGDGVSEIWMRSRYDHRDNEHDRIITLSLEVVGLTPRLGLGAVRFGGWLRQMTYHDLGFYAADMGGGELSDYAPYCGRGDHPAECNLDWCSEDHYVGLPYSPENVYSAMLPVEIDLCPNTRYGFRNVKTNHIMGDVVFYDRPESAPDGFEVVVSVAGGEWTTC